MILLYGCYGYTGTLIARHAKATGVELLLGGRDAARVAALGAELGFPTRAFALDAIDLSGVRAVLHAAGPYRVTSAPMAAACLRAGAHYLDITGEISVFLALQAQADEAVRAGVMLMPGVGFDVVPTDCMAAHLAARLPGASTLTLAIASRGGVSTGTLTTLLGMVPGGGHRHVGGQLVPGPLLGEIRAVDFGDKRRDALAVALADIVTAPVHTGIPEVETRIVVPGPLARALPLVRAGAAFARMAWARDLLVSLYGSAYGNGPDDATRAAGWTRVAGQVEHADGRVAAAVLRTPEAYTLTSWTALRCAVLARDGGARPGFATPAQVHGADFVLQFPGVERHEIARVLP